MNSTSTRRTARAAAALTAALGVLVALLALVAAPAQAATSDGWVPIKDRTLALVMEQRSGNEILHIAEERSDNQGFWYAVRSKGTDNERGFYWVHRQYGLKCDSGQVGFNGWLNTYTCLQDFDALDSQYPGWKDKTQACREATGQPWSRTAADGSYGRCSNSIIQWSTQTIRPDGRTAYDCAPWEGTYTDAAGRRHCKVATYSWATDGDPNLNIWVPEPDTCVGISPDANRLLIDGGDPNANVPDCTGDALAPNCTPEVSWHAACGGPVLTGDEYVSQPDPGTGTDPGPPPVEGLVRGTATITRTAEVNVTVSATRTVSAKVKRATITKAASKRAYGRVFRAKASRALYVTRSASGFATAIATGYGTARVTATCDKPTQAEADACAQASAEASALAQAEAKASAEARSFAASDAASQAAAKAHNAAVAAAKAVALTSTVKAPVAKAAKKAAFKKVLAKVRSARR